MFSRTERACIALLLAIFTCFTWRGVTMFYSGDDMMNMYFAWTTDAWVLARAQLLVWEPVYRPAGGAVYRAFYALFGFHPQPLYVFCWLLLAANVLAAYLFFRHATATIPEALLALSLILVHGTFEDLYYSAGTIYDRLCFLFTAGSLIAYFQFRKRGGRRYFALTCLLAILAMDSKESGVAVVPLIFCCEVFYFARGCLKDGVARMWLRETAPLLAVLSAIALLFVLGRVRRTAALYTTPTYMPHASWSLWIAHVAEYLGMLTYGHVVFSSAGAGVLLFATAAAAVAARSSAMMFGWLFFVLSITPVALISIRHGYVLYLPAVGIGLFLAAGFFWLMRPLTRRYRHAGITAFLLATIATTWLHASNWPTAPDPRIAPEYRLTEHFRRKYPALPPTSRLLFASDQFAPDVFDLYFNLCLLYGNKTMSIHRLHAPPDQRPGPKDATVYDHIFAYESGRYVELDTHDAAESIRLNILRDYKVAAEMDIGRPDHSAYVVSGLRDQESPDPWRWTEAKAQFKFKLDRAPTAFTARIFVPDVVASASARTLSILVNGTPIGEVPLKAGEASPAFPVPAGLIRNDGYTLVEMNVTNPYRDAAGVEYGIVLLHAAFSY